MYREKHINDRVKYVKAETISFRMIIKHKGEKVKLERAYGGCLGTKRRRRTW